MPRMSGNPGVPAHGKDIAKEDPTMRTNPEGNLMRHLYVVLAIAVAAVTAIIALGNVIGDCIVSSVMSRP
jgi:hypothetical protein